MVVFGNMTLSACVNVCACVCAFVVVVILEICPVKMAVQTCQEYLKLCSGDGGA